MHDWMLVEPIHAHGQLQIIAHDKGPGRNGGVIRRGAALAEFW